MELRVDLDDEAEGGSDGVEETDLRSESVSTYPRNSQDLRMSVAFEFLVISLGHLAVVFVESNGGFTLTRYES